MQGVSMPTHQYSHMAVMFMNSPQSYPDVIPTLTACTRAYTRVVLRLRAQAEAEERSFRVMAATSSVSVNKPNSSNGAPRGAMFSRPPSRAASPSSSAGHGIPSNNLSPRGPPRSRTSSNPSAPNPSESLTWNFPTFRSPLFRPRRAPLLQVFVPSPEGEWLSDASVLRCEAELKNAGVLKLLRRGDVIWDTAVGDEGNVGRMVWDGSYLIDLDYTYSRTGEIPQYLHSLAFPPSYFHRVIRTPANPICYVNIAPWSEEVASNLQLLQDRVRAETPQGGHHTVVRWVHRSSFVIRPPSSSSPTSPRIPIPGTSLVIDPGWYGTVVIEAEGTNEGLADLQNRCKGAFPPRAGSQKREGSRVFKILREKSRPAEIWLRTVGERERLM
ncbi:hypothetical protein JAAARDRAFT_136225 [Jaapia argillacea MUCL 33604]|uniref:Uncharacterized protein n=1 Tax=Jaapia argillacea MUCL 33604 TaxID=933084 RepID=A0A067PGR8_9AGAM|nr:hypothetical protein JAAARDRAFT_136225 [Jaapia argillacea MUCL 33604]